MTTTMMEILFSLLIGLLTGIGISNTEYTGKCISAVLDIVHTVRSEVRSDTASGLIFDSNIKDLLKMNGHRCPSIGDTTNSVSPDD